jgi:hypothetical protein
MVIVLSLSVAINVGVHLWWYTLQDRNASAGGRHDATGKPQLVSNHSKNVPVPAYNTATVAQPDFVPEHPLIDLPVN